MRDRLFIHDSAGAFATRAALAQTLCTACAAALWAGRVAGQWVAAVGGVLGVYVWLRLGPAPSRGFVSGLASVAGAGQITASAIAATIV